MSFTALLTALNEYVSDVLTNDCGRPVPDRQLTYHSRLPQDCCTKNGYLVTSWSEGHPSIKFPGSAANVDSLCSALPVYTVELRYVTCWQVPEVDEGGVVITDEQDAAWNNDALMLADVTDCVARALIRLSCASQATGQAAVDDYVQAVLDEVKQGWLRYVSASPIVPAAGCAGITWSMFASPRLGPVLS